MATSKSVNLTSIDAGTTQEAGSVRGVFRVFMDTVAIADGDFDADGDTVFLAQVPSNAKIVSIKTLNDDLDAGTDSAVNVGIYNGNLKFTTSAGTDYAADALIDEDAYASAVTTFQAANTSGTEHAFEARNINAINNYVWEDAGLPEDPDVPLRIVLTQTAAVTTDAAGDVSVILTYIEN